MQNLRTVINKKHPSHFGAFSNKCTKGKKLPLKSDAGAYLFAFNGKEKLDEINGAGNDLDFGARIYDSRISMWLSPDPFQYKYPGITPYNFSLNIPIMLSDPDGKDFRVSISKGNNGINTITIESTVHLYGPDADKLYNQIKGFTAGGKVTIDGQEYQLNVVVNYQVNSRLNEAIPAEIHSRVETNIDTRKFRNLGVEKGDNIVYVDKSLVLPLASGVTAQGEDDAKINNIEGYGTLIHESLHMLGLDERYTFGGGPDKNFKLDFMSNSPLRKGIDKIHLYDFAKYALENAPQASKCYPIPNPQVDNTGGGSASSHVPMDDKTYRDTSEKVTENSFYLLK
jgi:RHS repeat-associated protein